MAGPEILAEQAAADGVELEFHEQGLEFVLLRRGHLQGVQIHRAGGVTANGGQALGEQGLLPVELETLFHPAGQFAQAREQVLHAVELGNEFGGRFFADTGHARDVVGGISHQGEHVDHLLGSLHAPTFEDVRHAEDFHTLSKPGRFVEKRMGVNELAKVLVRRHHIGSKPFLLGAPDQGADDIVGLEAVAGDQGDGEGLDHPADMGQGQAEVFGHGLASRLVLGIQGVPLGRRLGVERDGYVGGLWFLRMSRSVCVNP